MLVIDVVLETLGVVGFTSWPITGLPSDNLLCLSGRMSSAEVGTAMAVIASYNTSSADDETAPDGPELLRRMTREESLIAPGGLRIRDITTNVEVSPGCCFGLENWRDWYDLLRGLEPWLGHAPSPRVEHGDGVIRIWQDGGDVPAPPPGLPIEVPIADLPDLLATAQQKLSGFLDLVTPWADAFAPSLTSELVAALNEHLHINESLETT